MYVPIEYVVRNVTWEVRDGTDMMYGVEDPAIMNTIDAAVMLAIEKLKPEVEDVEQME